MPARQRTTDGVPAVLASPPRGAMQARHSRARIRHWCIVAFAAVLVLAGCGGSQTATTASTSPGGFPSTPAGAQACWLLQAGASLPISNAAARAHFSQAYLAHNRPAAINSTLGVMQPLRLASVTSSQPNTLTFVMSVRGAQRFEIRVGVEQAALDADLDLAAGVPPTASPASVIPRLASGWVAQPVTFQAGGATIYGTYTHPSTATARTIPAAVLLAGSGTATDRNDNTSSSPIETARSRRQLAVRRRGREPALRQARQRTDRMGQVRRAPRARRDQRLRARSRRRAGLSDQAATSRPVPLGSRRAQRGRRVCAAARDQACRSRPQNSRRRPPRAGPRSDAELVRAGTWNRLAEPATVLRARGRVAATDWRVAERAARSGHNSFNSAGRGAQLELSQIDRYDPAAGGKLPPQHGGAVDLQQPRPYFDLRHRSPFATGA